MVRIVLINIRLGGIKAKNMKKEIFRLGWLLMMYGLLLSSCGNDGDVSSEPGVVTATVKYSMTDRYDLPKYFDMVVYYTNSEGKEVSEVVTSTTWEKSLTKVPVPGVYQFRVVYTRNNTPLEQDSYKFGLGLTLSYTTSSGTVKSAGNLEVKTVSQEKVEESLKNITERKISVEITK